MEELVFKTGAYEGPLELLLALIAKNKMNKNPKNGKKDFSKKPKNT